MKIDVTTTLAEAVDTSLSWRASSSAVGWTTAAAAAARWARHVP